MNALLKHLQKLFSKEVNASVAEPFLHSAIAEPLRSADDISSWNLSYPRRTLYKQVQSMHQTFVGGMPPIGQTVQFIKSNGVDGCVVYCQDLPDVNHHDYLCMLEEQKALLDTRRYILNVGDIKSDKKGAGIQQVYRYYLKPSMRLVKDGKSQQLYGNVTLQYVVYNDKPLHYRITANTYNDHKYHDPLPFVELMEVLWEV
jgi:hypothetical protein